MRLLALDLLEEIATLQPDLSFLHRRRVTAEGDVKEARGRATAVVGV